MKKTLVVGIIIMMVISLLPIFATADYDFETQNSNTTTLNFDEPTQNRNGNTLEYAGKIVSQGTYFRALLYFDVSSIPSNANITDANIWLHSKLVWSSGTGNSGIYRVNESWNSNYASWNVRGDPHPATAWTSPGGYYVNSVLDNFTYTQDYLTWEWRNFNITDTIQGFVNGSYSNYGFIIREVVELNWNCLVFHSDLYSPSNERPKLLINYTLPNPLYNITLYEDYWNFKGYPNSTNTNSISLFSEISNCKAITGKNLTSGYWYTYYPSLGLNENWTVKHGEALFIMVDSETVWQTYTVTTNTNITQSVWSTLAFCNPINKTSLELYSKISDCTAIVGKHPTSGYYYTYWPGLGLNENWTITFGDGLFILTSQDTTWDHT